MTPRRVLVALGAVWVSLVSLLAVAAWLQSDPVQSAAFNHAAWMFVLAGAMCAGAGMVMALTVALINEVRTARSVGQRSAKTLHGHHTMTAGAVRRVSSSQPARVIRE